MNRAIVVMFRTWAFWVALALILVIAFVVARGQQTMKMVPVQPHSSKDTSPACHCDKEALDFAIMDRLRENGLNEYNSTYTGSRRALDIEHKHRVKLAAWAGQLQDRCLRRAYLYWLSYYNGELDDAYAEITNRSQNQTENQRRDAELQRQFVESEECKRTGVVPPVPHIP